MAGVWVLVATTLLTLHQVTATHIVDAPWGRILGVDSVSVSGLNYISYLAIPYALPPVGNLRFAKPVAHPGLEDGEVFNATTLGFQCLQRLTFFSDAVGFSEDCLTLSVYVPVSPSSGPKSVMVWIHGATFSNGGAATYTPSELVTENDVIVVVIQYRVDAIGFLSCAEESVPGNFGLWDQNLAIRWVKTNIGAFGGDPESITIFGQSAGSVSVGLQTISPVSKGLKFKAILQGSTPLAPWAINRNPCEAFYRLASQTGCLDSALGRRSASMRYRFLSKAQRRAESQWLLTCLRGLDGADLIRELPVVEGTTFLSRLVFLPVVDGDFLPQNPAQLMSNVTYLKDIRATKRSIMLGVTNDGGAQFVNFGGFFRNGPNTPEGRKELSRGYIAEHLVFLFGDDLEKNPQLTRSLVNVLEFFYTQGSNNGDGTVNIQNLVDVFADIAFNLNTVMFVRDLARAKTKTKTSALKVPWSSRFLYLFNHFPTFKAGLPELTGTGDGELPAYEFDPVRELGNRRGFTDVEDAIGTIFRAMLTTFAKTGQPQVPLLSNMTSTVVAAGFSLPEEKFLSLESESRVDTRLFGDRVALWTDLVPSLLKSAETRKPPRFRLC